MSAKDLIGPAKQDDQLRLDLIKSGIDPNATEIRQVLDDTQISGRFAMRAEASADAGKAQSSFARLSLLAIVGTAAATLASGMLLYGAGAGAEDAAAAIADAAAAVGAEELPFTETLARLFNEQRLFIIGVQVIGAFVAAFATYRLSGEDLAKKWSDNRRRAEDLRQQIFTEIFNKVADKPGTPGDTSALSQAFELFRRFQLELQLNYYKTSARRTGRSSSRLGLIAAALAGLTAITGIIAGIGGAALVVAAFLGIAVPVALSAAQSWRVINLFGDKAKAYGKALEELQTLSLEVSAIRELAAGGEEAKVREFVDKVHTVMANENTNWVAAAAEGKQ